MFCCSLDTLYEHTIIIDPTNMQFDDQIKPISKKINERHIQYLMPKSQYLFRNNYNEIESIQSIPQECIEYNLSFSDQSRELIIQQIVKNPMCKIWKVLLKDKKQQLLQGDFFAFDLYEFEVYKMPQRFGQINSQLIIHSENKCRICFSSQYSQQNPLLNFCNCTGSIKYIHLQCNRQWLRQQMIINNSELYTTYQINRNNYCNICKSKWKRKIQHNTKQYYLYEFNDKPKSINSSRRNKGLIRMSYEKLLYLIVDDINLQESQIIDKYKMGLFLIKIIIKESTQNEQLSLKFGKSSQCDIIINPLLFSSIQCQIKLMKGKIIIKDCDSINGTYVYAKNLTNTQFNTKQGIIIKYDTNFTHIKGKNQLFSCLQKQLTYKLKFKQFKLQA